MALAASDLARIDDAAPHGSAAGDRYAPQGMSTLNR